MEDIDTGMNPFRGHEAAITNFVRRCAQVLYIFAAVLLLIVGTVGVFVLGPSLISGIPLAAGVLGLFFALIQ